MMRAVDIRGGKGDANALFINPEVPKPQPGESEALVKVKAFGLNRMDLLQREGRYPVPPQASRILGVEFSGTIEALGPHTIDKDFKIGDEVFGLVYGGAYAEYVAVSTYMLIHKPKELSWEQAAGIPEACIFDSPLIMAWITATQALFLIGEFSPGKSVLWHAGASSVSIAGIQLSKSGGASAVYVTAGSQGKIDFCVNELGSTQGFNYKEQDFAKEIKKVTGGKGVDIIIDFIGQNYFQQNLDTAAMDARIVTLGALSGTKLSADVDISAFVMKRLRFEGSTLRSRDAEYQRRLREKLIEVALPKFKDGSFRIFVERVFPYEQVVDAHKLLENNLTKGKIICTIK